jgi:hypothetical protein
VLSLLPDEGGVASAGALGEGVPEGSALDEGAGVEVVLSVAVEVVSDTSVLRGRTLNVASVSCLVLFHV